MPHRLDDVFRGDEFTQCAVYLGGTDPRGWGACKNEEDSVRDGRGGSGVGGLSGYLSTLTRDFDVCPIDPAFLQLDLDNQIGRVREFSSQRKRLRSCQLIWGIFIPAVVDRPTSQLN